MPQYFFDLMIGEGWLTDPEGMELSDGSAACAEALSAARGLIASEIGEGCAINLAHFIGVRDAGGAEIYRLHFRDAVGIHDTPNKD